MVHAGMVSMLVIKNGNNNGIKNDGTNLQAWEDKNASHPLNLTTSGPTWYQVLGVV